MELLKFITIVKEFEDVVEKLKTLIMLKTGIEELHLTIASDAIWISEDQSAITINFEEWVSNTNAHVEHSIDIPMQQVLNFFEIVNSKC